MPDQTVKHDNSLPGFLLILLPAAFGAVFLSVAWPFIVGAVVLLTGNSVWQSYQWAKLSQQVNPYFNQMVLEQQGEIAPLALSARANISAPIADRYLQGKAAEIGGVSYRTPNGGTVYSFLTVGSLENTFAGLSSNPSASQKFAELDVIEAKATAPTVTVVPVNQVTTAPVVVVPEPIPAVEPPAPVVIAQPETAAETVVAKIVAETPIPEVIEPVVAPVVAKVVEAKPIAEPPVVAEEVVVTETPPTPSVEIVLTPDPIAAVPAASESAGGSNFAQALRSIFNAENTETPVEEVPLESTSATAETISQTDLAKRLDVHPSTLYKRRSDMSFGEWTRNRDPEGTAWGYQRETKEFYRIT
jgi:hypothetical protein